MSRTPALVVVNRVVGGSADSFDRWINEIARPALETDGIPQEDVVVLRDVDDAVFVFLFYDGDFDRFDLERLLPLHWGAERAEQEMRVFRSLLERDQEGWALRRV